ncbi:hypothetical protein PpBr36_02811 [Pyricularia pennisetigena]|uniref:hypothetical protein n=1 Tax=Pyricularia pennisetigena TaxID=1578925 RepID=UPI0011541E1D|nr:hypothetical protein PpBr36_02811 [Pyricularia pennisetigena]TLS30966.1 hypothetical protein PpBr36_02811 [Pyricularia pennisetigena]
MTSKETTASQPQPQEKAAGTPGPASDPTAASAAPSSSVPVPEQTSASGQARDVPAPQQATASASGQTGTVGGAGSSSVAAPEPAAPLAAADDNADPGDVLEADDVVRDDDSALDVASFGGESASLASSILKYRVENGRTYHAYKAGYLQHFLCFLTLDDQLYICPAGRDGKQIGRVLDAGCGTGCWALDFADEHPESEVIGVDLSPIQPSFGGLAESVPPNVTFYVDDIEAEWTFSQPFDFIYMRMLSASIADWPKLIDQVYNNLSPGGWVEFLDPIYPVDCDDGTLPKDGALYKWSLLLNEAATKLGSSLDSGLTYKQMLLDRGFSNVRQVTYKWPISDWAADAKHKKIGLYTHENIMQGLQALSLALYTRALHWTPEELEVFLVDVRRDLKNRNIHAYWRIVVTYGQRPE